MTREVSLVRAELVDALRDYADVFRQKSAMEVQRAEDIEIIAGKVEKGGAAENPDLRVSQEWERQFKLLEMLFEERRLRCSRLIVEHGEN